MSDRHDLDRFGELYPGFERDRRFLKSKLNDPYSVWRITFEKLKMTEEFFQKSDEDVARETMRVLLSAIKPSG